MTVVARPSVLRLVGSAACISSSGAFVKLAGANAGTAAFLRCALALVVLVPMAVAERRRAGPRSWRLHLTDAAAGVLLGVDYEALKTLRTYRKGESDLIARDGVFYLVAVCEVPEAEQYEPERFIGVDLGIANIATTSTGYRAAGRGLNRHRKRQLALRRKLQKKRTQSARRRLKNRRRKEQRHAANVNHIISKTIVTEAERTSAGIALEDLTGIRQRVRLRTPQRVTLHWWAFAQLGQFIEYKARRAGVPLVYIDPAYTSQECAECQHTAKNNRVDQARFICRGCGVVAHADRNSSRTIAARGETAWTAGRESRVPATP